MSIRKFLGKLMHRKSNSRRQNSVVAYQRLESKTMLATIVVDTLTDSVTPVADGLASLREAVEAANRDQPFGDAPAGSGADDIVFDASLSGKELILAGQQILIRSALTIDGDINLNAVQQSRHFRIATDEPVSLSQLTLFNGVATSGGSLEVRGANVSLDGMTFRNNVAEAAGGAIFLRSGQLNINETLFERNRTTSDSGNGGAIHSDSAQLEISDSTFTNNSAARARDGSVHVLHGSATIENSTFEKTADALTPVSARSGGFIANLGSTVVFNSQFNSGLARTAGGAIQNLGRLEVQSSRFFDNGAQTSENLTGTEKGGAIYSTGSLNVSGRSVFDNNSASLGGAVFATGPFSASSPSRFQSNSARIGGAMRLIGDTFHLDDVVFSVNQSSGRGGAISVFDSQLSIVNPRFHSNGSTDAADGLVTQRGGAIDAVDTDIDISVTRHDVGITGGFNQNQALIAGGQIAMFGGALNMTTNAPSTSVRLVDFSDGAPTARGGAIFVNDVDVSIQNAVIGGHRVENAGGALYLHNSRVEISDSRVSGFSNEFAGAVFATAGSDVHIVDSSFDDASAKNNGGAIRVNPTAVVRIENSGFNNARLTAEAPTTTRGGAIYNLGRLSITGSEFFQNRASNQPFDQVKALGGAIFNSGELTIDSTRLRSNTANQGGAVYSTSPITITNTSFEGNRTERLGESPTHGAALFLTADADLSNSVFTNNIANNGGAIASFAGQIVGQNLTFGGTTLGLGNIGGVNNSSFQGGFGGAVFLSHSATAHFSSSTFENNSASRLGGAIAVFASESVTPSLTIDGESRFIQNNTVTFGDDSTLLSRGGAIGTYRSTILVRDSVFEENTANGDGGAVFLGINANAELLFADFESNQSEKRGGAIFNSGNLLLADSTVARNVASVDGGLSESSSALTTVERTEFVDNQP